jgi:hypothetical protein
MGHALADAIHERPNSRVLAIVGNLHARKTPFDRWPEVGVPAAGHLPSADILTLRVSQQGGEEWNCRSECGMNVSRGVEDEGRLGVILEADDDGAYDGRLALGPSTASPPIRPGV